MQATLRQPFRRRVTSVAIVLVAAVLAAACSGDDGETLRVYSGRHYDIEAAFEQFTDETGVKVEFLTGNDGELRERIAAEGDDTEADVYITVDAGNLAAAAAAGTVPADRLAVLDAAIPAELSDPDGQWFGLTIRARTIVYNPDRARARRRPDARTRSSPTRSGRVACACGTPRTSTSSRSSPASSRCTARPRPAGSSRAGPTTPRSSATTC